MIDGFYMPNGEIDKYNYDELVNKPVRGYVTPEDYGAKGDGVADDTEAVASALAKGVAVYLSKVYAVSNTITLGEGVSLFGDGSLKYTGESTNDYFVTTYASGTTWADIVPRDLKQEINIDCNGNAKGIYFSGGLHNNVTANVRNAKGTGYFVASGHGYENSHSVSVMNDDNAIYADSIGVDCDKSDEVFENIFTRNCNVGCKMSGSGLIKNIHSWVFGDKVYPNSTPVQFRHGHVTVQYLYADTMQYPVTFDGLYKEIYIGSMECYHNTSAVSSEVVTENPFRPWRAKAQPSVGDMADITIGKIVFPTINNMIQNKLNPLQPFDGFVTITAFCNLLVYGKTIHIPNCSCYIPSNALTDVPSSGYNNNYKSAHVYANDHYKIIELVNDYPTTDPMVKVQVNLTTWVAKWMKIAKEAIATVNPS